MEITVKIEAPGLMEALLAVAEQLQELNAHQAGKPVPTEAIALKAEAKAKKAEQPTIPDPVEVIQEVHEETAAVEDIDMETVRALVLKSKAHKERTKEFMTVAGVKKVTEMDQQQLNDLYKALQEV